MPNFEQVITPKRSTRSHPSDASCRVRSVAVTLPGEPVTCVRAFTRADRSSGPWQTPGPDCFWGRSPQDEPTRGGHISVEPRINDQIRSREVR
ncbi:MAG TPA: hypothetical protein VKB69_03840, partial [Micromonosporaceae bacterium]|nr:hypothetical protein [Micromonosporaceae bacterium]